MASNTRYYNLVKPEGQDNMTPVIFANNFDIIDDALAGKVGIGDLGDYATTEALRNTNLQVSDNTNKIDQIIEVLSYMNQELDVINGEDVGGE